MLRRILLLPLIASVVAAADTPSAPGGDEWKYDTVYRKRGEPFRGFVHEQNDRYVEVSVIRRSPGRPTISFKEFVPRGEVERVELLEPKEHEQLRQRLDGIRKERLELATRLKRLDPGVRPTGTAVENLVLKEAPWPPDPSRKARAYESTYFRLVTTARDEFAQLAATELEQAFTAYANFLPARVRGTPTTVLLTASSSEYVALVRNRGENFLNPAFFDVAKNQVVCDGGLQQLSDRLERVRETHAKRLKELVEEEAELKIAYKNKVPLDLAVAVEREAARIKQADENNTTGYRGECRRLFRRLYHEAFHAYLMTFVYPPDYGELPRWFNEGLAQIFEGAVFEVGELRIGHAEAEHADAVRVLAKQNQIPPLADILRSGWGQFKVAHASEKLTADRFYLTSWALAFYLTFERRVLGTKTMDDYVRALKAGVDPIDAFVALVGQPLPEFQKEFEKYVRQLHAPATP